MASDTEITKVRIVIRHLLWQIREVRKDRDAAWKWVNRFANTLQYQELEQDPDQYALAILAEARSFNDQQRRKGQMLGVRKQLAKEGVTSPTQEQLDEKWLEMYGNETTADGDTREDSQDRKSGTSANLYGDAGHREAPDESATVSDISGTPEALVNQTRGEADSLRGECHSAPPRTSGPMPEDRQVVIDFAVAEGLDVDDACECWYVTINERDGLTADGKKINSWKAYVRKWCTTRKNNRRTA